MKILFTLLLLGLCVPALGMDCERIRKTPLVLKCTDKNVVCYLFKYHDALQCFEKTPGPVPKAGPTPSKTPKSSFLDCKDFKDKDSCVEAKKLYAKSTENWDGGTADLCVIDPKNEVCLMLDVDAE